jgi:DNA repair protein RadD
MELRVNQIEPVSKGVQFFREKKTEPSIIVAPTAFGKSIVIAAIAKELDDKILIIQPSKELLEQNYNKFINLGGTASIFSSSFRSKEVGKVTYATIGTILKHGALFKHLSVSKVIIDECDRYPRDPQGMLRKFIQAAGIKHVLGLTATPLKLQPGLDENRDPCSRLVMLTNHSRKGMFFKKILHVSQIEEMVSNGFWAPLIYNAYDFNTKQLILNTSRSEYTDESIKLVYKNQGLKTKIVRTIEELSDRNSILVAVPSIEDAKELTTIIPRCEAVYSGMPDAKRKEIIEDFKSKKLRVIAQVNILSIGFDFPELDCIITARPTASLSWWYQFVGRLTRIHPTKKNGLVIDLVGSLEKFGKVEDFYFKNIQGKWELLGGEGRLLTGIPLHKIGTIKENDQGELIKVNLPTDSQIRMPFGKHQGKLLHQIPMQYREWMLNTFDWSPIHLDIKQELQRLRGLNR